MGRELRHEERFAVEVVRRATGATFTGYDDGSSDGMVDALFVLPDGTEGALEVTTLAGPGAMELEALTVGGHWDAPDRLRWAWAVWVGPQIVVDDLRRHLIPFLENCERTGQRDIERASWEGTTPAHLWLREQAIHGLGLPESDRHGAVDVIPDGSLGGAVHDDGDVITTWASATLMTNELVRKLDKLQRTEREERHLFVRIHDSALAVAVLHPLAFTTVVPVTPLEPTHGLTGLWLVPRWRTPILRWWARDGWAREDVLDEPADRPSDA